MTVLTRWQPFREITSLQERVNQLFNDVFSEIASPDRSSLTSFSVAPRTDVYEEDDRIVLEMEMPGFNGGRSTSPAYRCSKPGAELSSGTSPIFSS